jgi:PAS domain S-box-containing protein
MLGLEYFIEIFRVLPTPSLVLTLTHHRFTIVAVNDAYLQSYDLTSNEVMGKDFIEIFSPHIFGRSQLLNTLLRKALSSKKPVKIPAQQANNPIDAASKSKNKHLDVVFTPILNVENEVDFILCSITEVNLAASNRRNKGLEQSKLLKNARFLKETNRIAKVGTWDVNLVTRIVTWSDVQKEIHEVDMDFVPDWDVISQYYNLHQQEEIIPYLAETALKNGHLFDMELEFTTFKGNKRWVRTIGKVEIKEGKCVRMYGVSIDVTENRRSSSNLVVANQQIQPLLKTLGVVIWETDLQTNKVTFISEHVKEMLGFDAEQWKAKSSFWEEQLHPVDKDRVLKLVNRGTQKRNNFSYDYRLIRANGESIWLKDIISVVTEDHQPKALRGLMMDITDSKRLMDIELLEKYILELNGKKDSLIEDVLEQYIKGMEAIFPKVKCNLQRLKNNRLYQWSAPSLPEAYLTFLNGMPAGKSAGISGAAAVLKQAVMIKDIRNDPRTTKFRKILLLANVQSCWTYPLFNADHEVIGTFGIYHQEAKIPDKEDTKIIERSIIFLKSILENRNTLQILQETNILMLQCQEMAQFGNWSWDLTSDLLTWSDALYTMFGLKKGIYKPTFEAYLNQLHPEDKERVSALFGGVLSTKNGVDFEARIRRPDGEIRHFKSFAKLILNENGLGNKMIGAHFDVTESKRTQEELRLSESRLRDLVEAQTNYVTRIDFQGKFTYCNDKFNKDFAWLYDTTKLHGQDVLKVIFAHHYNRLFDLAENCISQPHTVYEIELEMAGEDGGIKVVLWHMVCLTDENGLPFEMQFTGIDITKREFVRKGLQKNNERNTYVNLVTQTAIYDWSFEKNEIIWGEGFSRLFGYDEQIGEYNADFWISKIHHEDFEKAKTSLRNAMRNKSQNIWEINYRLKKFDGNYVAIEVKAYIIRDDQGWVTRMISALRDISIT